MSTPKFVPGPYAVDQVMADDATDIVLDYDLHGEGRPILIGTVYGEADDRDSRPFTGPQIRATARLWAASPDLYGACRAFLDRYDQLREQWGDEGFTRSLADRVRAAVKLADEGRQPC